MKDLKAEMKTENLNLKADLKAEMKTEINRVIAELCRR